MSTRVISRMSIVACLFCSSLCFGEEVLFEDDFDKGLSSKWQVVGLKKEDYRIRDGGLELRVQPGKWTRETPMLKVLLPFATSNTVVASVDVTILDEFTKDGEFAGLCLIADGDVEFTVKKLLADGKLLLSPGKYVVRPFRIAAGSVTPLDTLGAVDSLEAARNLVPDGFYRMDRQSSDEPQVVENWI